MITDPDYNYTSPAGTEFILAAARFAAVNPSSSVLNLWYGGGAGAATLAKDFRCRVTGFDPRAGMLDRARELCERGLVSHLIQFSGGDPLAHDFGEERFDLVIAEGGFLNAETRAAFFAKLPQWTAERGWVAFAERIYATEQIPSPVSAVYGAPKTETLCEEQYRDLIKNSGLDLHFIATTAPSSWDNYYGNMAKWMTDAASHFGKGSAKRAINSEIKLFYRLDCLKYLAYMICVCRRN